MNSFLNDMKQDANYTRTENGALVHKSTMNKLLDMFAFGAAYRERSEADIMKLFTDAYMENPEYALKCLFYIRDIRGGQGERRFFRVVLRAMADINPDVINRNMEYIPVVGRWDDLYVLANTRCAETMFAFMEKQFKLDMDCKTPSLLGKWLKSENTSSPQSVALGKMTREAFGLSAKQYRKSLSALRQKINVLERLMSAGRWDEIQFDKIPSKAGFIYRNAFARNDVTAERYRQFMESKEAKVHADALYPYEVVKQAIEYSYRYKKDEVERATINKYWASMKDYFAGSSLNAICMVDTSGSMSGTPIQVAVSLGLYCAERCNGPFANHYISFSSRPQLIETKGLDFVDKVQRIDATNLCQNTNLEAAFDMVLDTAVKHHTPAKDLPENIIIITDGEFDRQVCVGRNYDYVTRKYVSYGDVRDETLMNTIEAKYNRAGYQLPKLIFWNVNARHNLIPKIGSERISYVSGFSPSIFKVIATGKTGVDLMMETLDNERYKNIR